MTHTPPRIHIPAASTLTRMESMPPDAHGYSPAVLPIKTSTDGMQLRGALYVQTGGRELSISNGGQIQRDVRVSGCGFRCTPENIYTKWLMRWYNVTGHVANSFFKACPVEHAIYWAPGDGDLSFDEVLFQNIAGSAIQLRLATVDNSVPPEQSPYWNTERTIALDNVLMLECSTDSGRGAFSFSPKSPGPNTDIVMRDCFIQTVHQTNVDGKGHDSFGGACFETMRSATLERCTIELKNPANGAVQAYEYDAQPSVSKHRAPHALVIADSIIENNVDIRIEDTPYVRISGCSGAGHIRLWKADRVNDKWNIVTQFTMAQGYSQG